MQSNRTGSISQLRRKLVLASAFCPLCKVSLARAEASSPFGCLPVDDELDLSSVAPLRPSSSRREQWMLGELDRLRREEQITASIAWIDGINAYALDSRRIVFGRGLAQVIETEIPDLTADQRDTIFRFVIGHEFTHLLQARQSGSVVPATMRGKELQADFGGGAWLALCLTSPGGELDFFQSARALRFAYAIGGTDWRDPAAHGTSNERWDACFIGTFKGRQIRSTNTAGSPSSHRLSAILFGPEGLPLAIAPEMMASLGRQWDGFFSDLSNALIERQPPPTSPSGINASQEADHEAYFYAFDATATQTTPHPFEFSYYDRSLRRVLENWSELSVSQFPLPATPPPLRETADRERQRLLTLVNDPGAQIVMLHIYQDLSVSNARITCGLAKDGSSTSVVIVASIAPPLTDDQKRAFERLRDQYDRQAQEKVATEQELEDEPFEFARQWLKFLELTRAGVQKARNLKDFRNELTQIALPEGVVISARPSSSEVWVILLDSVDPRDEEKRTGYISEHITDTFSSAGWEERLPVHLGINDDDTALASTAAGLIPKRKDGNDLAFDEHHVFAFDDSSNARGALVELLTLRNQSLDDAHYHRVIFMRISWSVQ